MSKKFVVIHEARADFDTATELADQVLLADIDWLDFDLIEHQLQWIEEEPSGSRLSWKSIPNRARGLGIRVHGHFDGEPGFADAQAARRAIHCALQLIPELDAILLIRDIDDDPNRRHGLEQARRQFPKHVIVIGAAIIERESWVICGFEPVNDEETARVASERQKLGFDPRLRSHELTAAKNDQALRSPKRVLKELTGGDFGRERRCWNTTPLQTLRDRGTDNGLLAYLDEIATHLVPIISGNRID